MSKQVKTIENALGRPVPVEINGRPAIPFQGVGQYIPTGRKYGPRIRSCADYPSDGDKRVATIKDALIRCGIRDGMTISTHHHLRDGDTVANMVFQAIHELGVKNIVWYPSASFACHAGLIDRMKDGTIQRIEGSMNGPLGRFTSIGGMEGMAVLRSHGGRYQAVQDGEVVIDIAVISAPAADAFGNANGVRGPAACGLLGFALADSQYADHVVVVTDNLEPFPCIPWQIHGNYVDYVVEVPSIGDPAKIVSGTTQITKSPDRLLIAEWAVQFAMEAGLVRNGFSFQAGAGGTSLSFSIFLAELMRKNGIKARFVRGGSNQYMTAMLEEGLTDYILDGQTFDLEGVRSMRENPAHQNTSPFTSYNYHGKGNFASMVDIAILGATEVDVNFHANVVTHSDGLLLHGIGGWQNCLFGRCVILPIPLFRDRIPVIRDAVTTLCGPGELVDVIVTERGIAINPRRQDLFDALKNTTLPLRTIEELKTEAETICGGPPAAPKLGEEIVAAIKWVDGTVIDCVRRVILD
ncbi:citrate lyase subunit alpha [bacterium]|nr:citrate lyase subunit alpha [candidate division CSSED10-310 bacterium]